MSFETKKTLQLLDQETRSILNGNGIDIGCGNYPVTESVYKFDMEDGDANEITKYVDRKFDYVWSSHCLEHMNDPYKALAEWWRLVKDNGYLFLIIPDEDLYEQGKFPSKCNCDHKSTFTISKNKSWSPVSVNVLSLVSSLPDAKMIKLELQDNGYDRRLLLHDIHNNRFNKKDHVKLDLYKFYVLFLRRFALWYKTPLDQTRYSDVTAQIFVQLQKAPEKD